MAVPQFLVWERILVLLLGGAEGNHCCLTSGQPETYSPAALSDEGKREVTGAAGTLFTPHGGLWTAVLN